MRGVGRGIPGADSVLEMFIVRLPEISRVAKGNLGGGLSSTPIKEDVVRRVRMKFTREFKFATPLGTKDKGKSDKTNNVVKANESNVTESEVVS